MILARYFVGRDAIQPALDIFRSADSRISGRERVAFIKQLISKGVFHEAFEIWQSSNKKIEENALVDADFEETSQADESGFGWQSSAGVTGQAVKLSLDQSAPISGKASLKVDFSGTSNPSSPLISQLVPITPGTHYRLTFSFRTKNLVTGGLPVIRISEALPKGETKSLAVSDPFPSNTERKVSMDFTVPSSSAIKISLERLSCPSTPCPAFGTVWLDSLDLKKL
jgi:hypothetical protein